MRSLDTPSDNTSPAPAAKIAATGALGASELLPAVYEELRAMARRRMAREGAGHTLQTTALVHEAYLKLAHGADRRFADRGHFFRAAAVAMQRILIEHARGKGRLKRAPQGQREPISNVLDLAGSPDSGQILALDEAIGRLEEEAPQAAAVVRQRFYCGLSIDETAEALEMSPRTVDREWTYARAWLFRRLADL
ncbi:MAG: ECF-type sigma factor [Tepidisphaerales bacterium]